MALEITTYKVKARLDSDMLGTVPVQDIFEKYIAANQTRKLKREGHTQEQIDEKIESVLQHAPIEEDPLDRGLTGFCKDEHGYYVDTYWIKGSYKSAANVFKTHGALKQLRSKVVNYLTIRGTDHPDRIYVAPVDAELKICERPLRASTPLGERTAIARSYTIPAGKVLEWYVDILDDVIPESLLVKFHEYGQKFCGLGQWRTSGKGRYTVLEFSEV